MHAMTDVNWNLLDTYCKNVTCIPHSCSTMALKQVTLYILMLILATAQSLRLVKFGRSGNHPGDNRILLECQRSNTLAVPNPQIFVERSDLARQPVRIAGNEAGQVSIIITQELEGWYSCSDGHNRSTNMLALVGKESSIKCMNWLESWWLDLPSFFLQLTLNQILLFHHSILLKQGCQSLSTAV